MPPNDRQERRLARQRGAGTRELKNANFGFTIGAPPLPAKKSTGRSKTPQALPARPSSLKTPQAEQGSSRKTPAQSAPIENAATARKQRSASTPKTGNEKRIRTGKAAAEQFKTPTVIGKRKRGAGEHARELEEDELEADDEDYRTTGRKTFVTPAARQSPAARGGSVEQLPRVDGGVDELEEADADHTISSEGRNAGSSSIVLPSASRPTPRRGASGPPTPIALVPQASQPGQITTPFIDPRILTAQKSAAKASTRDQGKRSDPPSAIAATGRTTNMRTPLAPVANMLPLPSTSAGTSTLKPPTRIINDISPLFQPNERPDAEGSTPAASTDVDAEGEKAEEFTSVARAGPSTQTATSRRRASKIARKEVRTSAQKAPKRKAAGRPQPHPTKKRRESTPDSVPCRSPESQLKNKPERITVPIAVYKPTDPQNLYTYSSAPPDADPLGADPVPSLNPADVLAQISTEITTQFIRSYDDNGDGNAWASEGARRRQKAAVSKFHRCLQDSLFALASAASAVAALGTRARKVKRRRVELRDELVRLRREREEVGVEMDRVRTVHRRGMEAEEERGELNQGLFDIESAVARGRARARALGRSDEGPELGILEMRERVVGGIGENGLLSMVQDMNVQLERAASVLEGRA